MIGYAELEVFTGHEQWLLTRAQSLVATLNAHDSAGEYVRCHELARAVGSVLGLQVCDGHYGMVEHSWLWTRTFTFFEQPPNILDVYCPGRLPQVQLVHSSAHLPYEYRRGVPRDDVRAKLFEELRVLCAKGAA